MSSISFLAHRPYPHQIQGPPLLETLQMVGKAGDTHCGTKPGTSLGAGRLMGLSKDCLPTAVGEERCSSARPEAR